MFFASYFKAFAALALVFASSFALKAEPNTSPSTSRSHTPTLELASRTRRTTIELDEQKIKGVRRIPLGSLITEQRSKLKIQLIMKRKAWKKKIINSTDWL